MWSSRLFWKSLILFSSLYFMFAAYYLLRVAPRERELLTEQLRNHLHEDALQLRTQLADYLINNQHDELHALVADFGRQAKTRLTVIDREGNVMADSDEDPQRMRDHAERPEIRAAVQYGSGEAIRQSATIARRMFYFALPIRADGELHGFVRVALPFDEVDREVAGLNRQVLFLVLCFGLLVIPVNIFVVRSTVKLHARLAAAARAIAAGDYHEETTAISKGDSDPLTAAFQSMQAQIKQRIENLQQTNERMLTVLSGMTEGVIAVDRNQRLMLANPASISLLEITAKDVVGRQLLEVIRSRDVQLVVVDCLQSTDSQTRERTMTTGNRRLLRLLAARLPGSPCPGVVVVLHDITDLRRLENLRRDFVANVSHELKTPLAAIKAYAETLRLGAIEDPTNRMKFVERIEEQANRLHQLILDLLQLARVETGKESFQFEEVPINEAVETCIEQFQEKAANSGVRLTIESPKEPLSVWADVDGLQTVLDNLVTNAIKYTPRGGQVTVRWRRDARFAIVDVQDTGIGIATQDQHRIFERFYRVDRARSRELGGTGLGLAIVKHLVQAFGGEITVRSELGHGSTFSVKLPLGPTGLKET